MVNRWPRDNQTELKAFYGTPDGSAKWEVTNLVTIQPPWKDYLAGTDTPLDRGFRVNKLVAESLNRVLLRIWELHNKSQTEIEKFNLHKIGGAYLYRKKRGSDNLSLHAFGAAIDIDPEHNKMFRGNKGVMQARVIAAFEEEGWKWGGNFGDPMHFEATDNGKPQGKIVKPLVARDPAEQLVIVEDAVALVKRWESFMSRAYDDRGHLAIGYGHTAKLGTPPLLITKDMVVTEAQADAILRADLKYLDDIVDPMIVRKLTDNQYGAVLSFCYNLGPSNFKVSSLLKYLNLGEFDKAAKEFPKWNKSTNPKTKVKETLPGLTKRRASEQELFLKG